MMAYRNSFFRSIEAALNKHIYILSFYSLAQPTKLFNTYVIKERQVNKKQKHNILEYFFFIETFEVYKQRKN